MFNQAKPRGWRRRAGVCLDRERCFFSCLEGILEANLSENKRNLLIRNVGNVPSNMYVQTSLKSACECGSAISVFIVRVNKFCILGYPKRARQRFSSACANAQADLSLGWACMFEGAFLTVAAQSNVSIYNIQTDSIEIESEMSVNLISYLILW